MWLKPILTYNTVGEVTERYETSNKITNHSTKRKLFIISLAIFEPLFTFSTFENSKNNATFKVPENSIRKINLNTYFIHSLTKNRSVICSVICCWNSETKIKIKITHLLAVIVPILKNEKKTFRLFPLFTKYKAKLAPPTNFHSYLTDSRSHNL